MAGRGKEGHDRLLRMLYLLALSSIILPLNQPHTYTTWP